MTLLLAHKIIDIGKYLLLVVFMQKVCMQIYMIFKIRGKMHARGIAENRLIIL